MTGSVSAQESSSSPDATLYWRPGCPLCMRMRLVLRAQRVRIHQVNIWRDAQAAAIVRSVADGNETVPTVVFADGSAWVNPPPGQVVAALRD